MADTIERLYKLTVDGAQAARDLNAIAKSTENVDKRMDAAMKSIKGFAAALTAGLTVGAVISSIQRNIDAMDELSKAVSKVGIAAEDLQKLRFAADLSGVSAEELDKSIGKLAISMSDLETGTTDAHKALREIGVQSGDSPTAALAKIADQFAKMPDGIDKTAMAIKIFGKAGADLIPLLNGGSEGLKELGDQAERYGGILSGGTLKAAEEFNDNMSRLQRVTAGVSAQFTAGMLPALQTLTQYLVDASKKGDGFVTTGARMGDILVNIGKFALWAAAQLQVYGIIAGATAASVESPTNTKTIFEMAQEDIKNLREGLEKDFAKIDSDLAKFKAAAAAPVETPKPGTDRVTEALKAAEAAEAAAKKQREADAAAAKSLAERTKAINEHRKAEEAAWKSLIEQAQTQERIQKDSDDRLEEHNKQLSAQVRAILAVDKAAKDRLDTIEEEGARLQYLVDLTDESTEAYQNSTEAQRAYARAQLAIADVTGRSSETMIKQQNEMDVLNKGFEDFFSNLAQGTADVEDLFKRMAQSIIAELLKIWAKKYIIDTLVRFFNGGSSTANATGNAFDSGAVVPFARGGVISQPIMFPMALAGEAGPEAIVPLRRTASGDLGVQAQQQPLQITINNNAPNVAVATRQTPEGLEITVEQVKAALVADVLRGGNDFASAAESAWGLSRGHAAAF